MGSTQTAVNNLPCLRLLSDKQTIDQRNKKYALRFGVQNYKKKSSSQKYPTKNCIKKNIKK